jgi:hypothetical protein
VSLTGSREDVVRMFSSLSFADIQKVVVDALKSMILRADTNLRAADITQHLRELRRDLSAARVPSKMTTRRCNQK